MDHQKANWEKIGDARNVERFFSFGKFVEHGCDA
jgi:hypothetical protein